MMKFTDRQLKGFDPIVVYDQDFTYDEEGEKVPRTSEEQVMFCVGVLCTRPENLAPSLVAFPCPEGDFKAHEFSPVPHSEEEGFYVLAEIPKAKPTAEQVKEAELRKQFEEKRRQDLEAEFEQFKQEKV